MTVHLVLARQPAPIPSERGGVEILDEAMVVEGERVGYRVHVRPRLPSIDDFRLGEGDALVVFTQEEGRLTPQYEQWAQESLSRGAWIVEKNIFALPSRWRPSHPRYIHALMSADGAYRFAWRSWVSGIAPPQSYLILANPLRAEVVSPNTERTSDEFRILRVGRPDPIKWSDWELRFGAAIARAMPDRQVRLDLVGAPTRIQEAHLATPPNLHVVHTPYTDAETLLRLYSAASIYSHYSKIGETYGNTIAEAQASGAFCVVALDPEWDAAPLEFLDPVRSAVGTPRRLLKNINSLLQSLNTPVPSRTGERGADRPPARHLTDAQHLALIAGILDEGFTLASLPTPAAALRYLRTTGSLLGGTTGAARGLALESQRAFRTRLR